MININKQLFWDTRFSELDYKKNANFIIARVLSYGDIFDYKDIKKQYGFKKIKSAAKRVSYFDKKSLYFWSYIFNLPLNSLKCIKKF